MNPIVHSWFNHDRYSSGDMEDGSVLNVSIKFTDGCPNLSYWNKLVFLRLRVGRYC